MRKEQRNDRTARRNRRLQLHHGVVGWRSPSHVGSEQSLLLRSLIKKVKMCHSPVLCSPLGACGEGAAVPTAPWIIFSLSRISLDCFSFYLRGRGKKGV